MNGSVIVDKWQINWCHILWMHVCVLLVPFVCLPLASHSCVVFLFSTHDLLWLCFCVCLCVFSLLSSLRCPRRSWETRPRRHWARSHHPPPVLHWLKDILISGMLLNRWLHGHKPGLKTLFDPTRLLFIDSLNPFLELQRPIWTRSAQWTGRGLSKDTHLSPTYRRSVLGQRAQPTVSPHEKQHVLRKVSLIFV